MSGTKGMNRKKVLFFGVLQMLKKEAKNTSVNFASGTKQVFVSVFLSAVVKKEQMFQ
ncbi:MAG: hypothetical protein IJ621_03955 [Paludibacteraceae bacterium]|nr:hypothetical protein [Paludibacteraceae bacterium]